MLARKGRVRCAHLLGAEDEPTEISSLAIGLRSRWSTSRGRGT